ncbi:hypothetical protein BKA00_006412 [Actinomadura coerulea]|uniref:Cytochrome P450 n=1 Tax=Actinomadura coerulea TaxID=46159 RepID=A0A7X0L2C5_9ACTN|nr:hypothetical protein [Actinomadura coerulea]MBB6399498.1 hypothetical protein [Actinomadura coerulea]
MSTVQTREQTAEAPPAKATVADTLRIGAAVFGPTLARGVLARRPRLVALAEAAQADGRAGRLLRRLRARYGSGPLRLTVPGRSFALVLSPRDIERVLTGSPEPFAIASKEKRAAVGHFQPHGVLASHGRARAGNTPNGRGARPSRVTPTCRSCARASRSRCACGPPP